MTTLIPFNPSPNANFQFQCTLDGAPYNVICTFSAYAQRYYVTVYDLTGEQILSRPLIASPSFYNVSLTLGFFDTTMIYRESSATFEIPGIPAVPMTRPPRPATPPPPPPPPPPPAPLDPYASGITFCYGRRRLLSLHGGALYRVRRAIDDHQKDITAGDDGTDTVSLMSFVGSGTAYLVTWYDQSPAANDLTQPTASKQPLVVNAGTILTNFHPDGVNDGLVSIAQAPSSAGASIYFAGLPYPATGTGTPLIGGINGTKYALMTYAILGGGINDGLQPSLGPAHGNVYNQGLVDNGYTAIFDTTLTTIFDQVKVVVFNAYSAFHGETGGVDHNPISAGLVTYAADTATFASFSQAQLRAMVGWNVAHDLATATAINTILVA